LSVAVDQIIVLALSDVRHADNLLQAVVVQGEGQSYQIRCLNLLVAPFLFL